MIWGMRVEGALHFAEYVGSMKEWKLEHGFKQGPRHGGACRYLDQQIVSTIPARILPGME